ncbi:copper chaperone PCu(A)C [Wenzhouxiangella marina]|uniref:Uncharacterized protein n=1 Tax=Wenzhouxiangella marina TaxID=1579979 RepID=A0A0K0XXE4_9GAMM|nr:copper chaperone PCu(A)C [Wenzhouxiangella marina]AKS42369.1 hypothetical protein WM2015_2003 [Wenzhouxiangella marina]MBB6085858.1 hypothetical protein [Wenzhouxiangella marina]
MIRSTLSALFLLILTGPAFSAGALRIEGAWSPLAPPGRMMAGFMEITNTGDETVRLVDARSDRFGRVEIHTMRMVDGVMRMRRVEALEIQPGEKLSLAPGGFHLMLMQPQGAFELGDHIELTLIDENGGEWPLRSEVRPRRNRR